MARNHYKLTERSYINDALREVGEVVLINDDPSDGGMTPGSNLVLCEADGTEAMRPVRRAKKATTEDIG